MKKRDFVKFLLYKLQSYYKATLILLKHILGKPYYKREESYYDYIAETKQLNCPHKKISKLTSTKFYCSECGKVLHLIPEEVAIVSDLITVLIVGSIIYLLTRPKKGT